jgi:hypothetical protein
MKTATVLAVLLGTCLSLGSFAQTVGRKPPKVVLKDYSPKEDDGTLEFEVDVRMADCISYVEVKNPDSKKPVQVQVNESNYYLSEENGKDIMLRLNLGSLKELLRKKQSVAASLTIFSKSGKPIYTNPLSINKAELISAAGGTGTALH